jgi:hypothetical protein
MMSDLLDLENKLAAAGRAARAELADAASLESAPTGEAPRPPRMIGRAVGGRRRLRILVSIAVAAAALVLWFSWPVGKGGQPPVYLGDEAMLQPRGASASFVFRWDVEQPAGGFFVLRVRELDPGPEGRKLLHESSPIHAQEWTPDPEIARAWPRRIHWELLVYDGSSPRPAALHSADAWLE